MLRVKLIQMLFFAGFSTVTMTILIQRFALALNMSFKSLVSAVTGQCQEIKQALALIPYFENWEPDLVAEFCRVSSIMEFPPGNIILGPDTENSHMVYFILEGVCKIIQNLYVEVKTNFSDQKLYKLCNFSKVKTLNNTFKNEQYYSTLFNCRRSFQTEEKFKIANLEKDNSNTKSELSTDEKNGKEESSQILNSQVQESKNKSEVDDIILAEMNNANQNGSEAEIASENLQREQKSQDEGKINYEPDHHRKILQECKKRREETIRFCKKVTAPEKPKNVESIFMQTGFLFKGACFGLDKCVKENFISVTKVKCLRIPQRFLLHHNPRNIWNRIRLFYSLYFPKEEQIFESFQSDRKWIERKKRQTEEIVYLRNLFNYTLINDVPYFIRLTEKR